MSNEFDWASDNSNDASIESPFEVGAKEEGTSKVQELVKESANMDIAEYGVLPKITFTFIHSSTKYVITTDDPILSQTQFNMSLEIDRILVRISQFKQIVFEAYLGARRQRKIAEKDKKFWVGNKRKEIINSYDKKPTLQAIEDELNSEFTIELNNFDDKINYYLDEEERLLALDSNLKDRAFYLGKIAERFNTYPEIYGDGI